MLEDDERRPAGSRAARVRRSKRGDGSRHSGRNAGPRGTRGATGTGIDPDGPSPDPAAAEKQCRSDALRLLTIRERTRRGLVTALVRRQHERTTAISVVEHLAESGWVDDARYARLRLQSAVRARPESLRILTMRLRQDGCDDETIRAAIEETKERVEGFDELELARRLVRKKLRSSVADRQKILSALIRKGFPAAIVRQALQEAEADLSGGRDSGDDDSGDEPDTD